MPRWKSKAEMLAPFKIGGFYRYEPGDHPVAHLTIDPGDIVRMVGVDHGQLECEIVLGRNKGKISYLMPDTDMVKETGDPLSKEQRKASTSILDKVAVLQAENAALREALAALADDAYDNAGWRNVERNECNYCMADVVSAEGEPVDCDHGYGCPVARARALLVNGATRDNK